MVSPAEHHESCYDRHDNGEEIELNPLEVLVPRVHSFVAANHGPPLSVETSLSLKAAGIIRVQSIEV
jgi:hypothetical protein